MYKLNTLKKTLINRKIGPTICLIISLPNLFFGQNLLKNSIFSSNLNNWTSSINACPTSTSFAWTQYSAGLLPNYPTIWEGTAFLKNKITTNQFENTVLSQNVVGLLPAQGNSVKINLDVIIGESMNKSISEIPIEYLGDNITLEIWFGGIKYASVTTPSGWHSALGNEFGACFVSYFNGATSLNYNGGNTMKNISSSYINGNFPFYTPAANTNWDIIIPWDCTKTSSALFEIRVNTNMFLNKLITDTRNQTYNQTCLLNDYSNLDEIAVDNISINNNTIVETPSLLVSNLTSSTCGQNNFNLSPCVNSIPTCPIADNQSLEYNFFTDKNLLNQIPDPTNYIPTGSEQIIYVVLASKVADPEIRKLSSIKRELKITKNDIITGGLIGSPYELCSNTFPIILNNIISPIGVSGANIEYFWEKSVNNFSGPYTAAAGINTEIEYTPSGLTTANEIVTNYFFRRKTKSTLNGLTCETSTSPVNVTVKPCAPISKNNTFEYVSNPGGINTVIIPNTLFSGTALVGSINYIKLIKFPIKATSITINTTNPSAKLAAATTYCGTPAAIGCVGVPFPNAGILLATNTVGNPVNVSMALDPLDGSILVEFPFVSIDSRGFVSTEANPSILFGNGQALPIKLRNFEIEKLNNDAVILNWQTEKEINFSHFEIQAAINSFSFMKIGDIIPNEKQIYTHHITALKHGVWYFRLKMVNNDGTFEYSKILSQPIENKNDKSIILKNPSGEFVNADINMDKGNYQFHIVDISGKITLSFTKYLLGNEKDLILNQKPLSKGIHLLQIFDDFNKIVVTKKILVE